LFDDEGAFLMNIKRIAILGVAAIAAGAAAMMVRGMVTSKGAPQADVAVAMTEILVASQDVSAGHPLDAALVRWQAWPEKAIMATFISKAAQPDLTKAVAGTVARTPLISGEPITETGIVRTNAAGFMAATVTPGMRAIGLPVTAETIAGGFILPNDRVDVVLTREISNTATKLFESSTILSDVRVLAVDTTAHQGKDQENVIGKTATLEVTEPQAELVAKAQQSGVVSLTLRSIGDSSGTPTATDFTPARQIVTGKPSVGRPSADRSPLLIYRYGVLRDEAANSGSAPAAETSTEAPAPAPQPTVTEGPVALETPR
jgi:pilus assembly protein CpaB